MKENTTTKLISDIIPSRKNFVANLVENWRTMDDDAHGAEFRDEIAKTLHKISARMDEVVATGQHFRGVDAKTPRGQTDIIAAILESKGYKVKMYTATSGDDEIWIEWAQHEALDEKGKPLLGG